MVDDVAAVSVAVVVLVLDLYTPVCEYRMICGWTRSYEKLAFLSCDDSLSSRQPARGEVKGAARFPPSDDWCPGRAHSQHLYWIKSEGGVSEPLDDRPGAR